MVAEKTPEAPHLEPAAYTAAQVCTLTGLRIDAVRLKMRTGEIPRVRLGRRAVRVPGWWIEALRKGEVSL